MVQAISQPLPVAGSGDYLQLTDKQGGPQLATQLAGAQSAVSLDD